MINNFIFLAALLFFPFHDFHVTHTNFYFNEESKSIEVTIKVAIEDIEKSIQNLYPQKFDSFEDNLENRNLEKLILKYFRKNLTLLEGKSKIEYQWVGKEMSNNLHDIYFYFEIPNYNRKGNKESITIKNTIFLDLYNYQTNIVLIELIDKKYNLTFTMDNNVQTILMNNND